MFYARRRRRKLSPDRVDAWITSYEKEVPALLRMPGFMGTYLLADRSAGEGESYSFWGSKEALESTRSSTDALGLQQKAEIGLETVSIENLEVIVKTGDKVHTGATHAAVLERSVDPDRLDAARAQYAEKLLPALREDAGFLGALVLADTDSGKTVALTLYDSLANLESAVRRQDQLQSEFTREVLPQTPAPESRHYEIIARTATPPRAVS